MERVPHRSLSLGLSGGKFLVPSCERRSMLTFVANLFSRVMDCSENNEEGGVATCESF